MSATESVKCFLQLSAISFEFFGPQHGVGCRLRLPRHSARAVGLPDTACGAELAAGVAATPQTRG